MKVGDLVIGDEDTLYGIDGDEGVTGIVLEVDVNMWEEEIIPTGIKVLWSTGEIDVLYEDEIDSFKERFDK